MSKCPPLSDRVAERRRFATVRRYVDRPARARPGVEKGMIDKPVNNGAIPNRGDLESQTTRGASLVGQQ